MFSILIHNSVNIFILKYEKFYKKIFIIFYVIIITLKRKKFPPNIFKNWTMKTKKKDISIKDYLYFTLKNENY